MNVEWNIPFELTSPYGTILLNAANDFTSGEDIWYVLDPKKCVAFAGIRQTSDPMPQAHGSILHREFTEGYSMRLGGEIFVQPTDGVPACGADLRRAWDELQLHLHALLGADVALTTDNARLAWTPTDYGKDRLLTATYLLEELTPSQEGGGPVGFSFAVHSAFPYAVEEGESTDALDVTIWNPGNCVVYPNFKVYGPCTNFTLANETTGQIFLYDGGLPGAVAIGGGDYAFVGCFANNIFLNDDQVNLMAGVDVEFSEFFGLQPGLNEITITDATADMLWTPGWV